jgi:putative membrane-bound dehydrogenase-like protein
MAAWNLLTLVLLTAPVGDAELPRSLDPALKVELIAAEPDLVTPTGIAVDASGRVLVVESHTHFRPKDYQGPEADRIRSFEDADGDGRFETIKTVYEGSRSTMNVAVERDGSLLIATRNEIFRLRRDHGAGKPEQLVRLETPGDYPHNGLSGFAIAFDGSIAFGLGENLGASYKLIGADGSTLEGGGEGGNIYRVRPDGSGLTRVATGFWNPFHLALDSFGRLFAVDNDPDSRPPCRLLHVVEGGDYGYRFRNGRRGLHPLTAWDGDLPGTLPMLAGTGEAPSGVLVYESDGLPASYRGAVLVTSWGDHRIDRFDLEPSGATFRARRQPVIVGGEDFRPVGIAVAPDGSLFVSDWVDRSYSVHGKGRLWRIRSATPTGHKPTEPLDALGHTDRSIREEAARTLAGSEDGRSRLRQILTEHRLDPRARAAAIQALLGADDRDEGAMQGALTDPSEDVRSLAVREIPAETLDLPRLAAPGEKPGVRFEALRRLADRDALIVLTQGLESADPFLRHAAVEGLGRSFETPALRELARSGSPVQRLGAVLALRRHGRGGATEAVTGLLRDVDPHVRLAAVQWVAESNLVGFRGALEAGLASEPISDRLFRATLAAMQQLDGNPTALDGGIPDRALMSQIAFDPTKPPTLRRLALRSLPAGDPSLDEARIESLLESSDSGLRCEAVRRLRERPGRETAARLESMARDASNPVAIRAEAIAGLDGTHPEERELLVALARDGDSAIRRQAARSLRALTLDETERGGLRDAEVASLQDPASRPWADPVLADLDSILRGGDPAEGERVFFHPKGPGCFRCHQVDGRGERIGPDLSMVGRAASPEKVVRSILRPSEEIAPQFTAYQVARTDGTVATGLLVVERDDATHVYADPDGRTFLIEAADIEERLPLATSIMPDGLDRTMTAEEFRDLVAFLLDPGSAESPVDSGRGR